jgi:hypothetical protein
VDLGSCFDQILQVCTSKKVSQLDEFAMILVFDVDDSPLVSSSADHFAVDVESFLRAYDSKRDFILS